MTADYLGPEGPHDERAHSPVTNPERFAPPHDIAAELFNRLEVTFDLKRAERYGLGPEPEAVDLAPLRARLIPRNPGTGVFVRFGRWYIRTSPGCGCDTCGETLEDEAERLNEMIEDLSAGTK